MRPYSLQRSPIGCGLSWASWRVAASKTNGMGTPADDNIVAKFMFGGIGCMTAAVRPPVPLV